MYALAVANPLTLVKSEGGRLEQVRLTQAGERAVAELGSRPTRRP